MFSAETFKKLALLYSNHFRLIIEVNLVLFSRN